MGLKILEFDTIENKYIFDGQTGTVIAVDDILLSCIKKFEHKDREQVYNELSEEFSDKSKIRAAIAFGEKYKEYGAFYCNSVDEKNKLEGGKKFSSNLTKKILDSGYTQQLVLNVTEDCNMRCKYCYLSETYKYTRNRTNTIMSEETAYKALDYYFKIMSEISKFNPGKKCAITFYGGEALMNFDVIKKSIEYAKKNAPVEPLFNLTTNGLLFTEEKAEYLVNNDVAITISLDGNREEHNRNRVGVEGNNTFDPKLIWRQYTIQ